MKKKLKYAMVGGAKGSFIGPIHRIALRMDNLADIAAGCFSRNAEANREMAEELGIADEHVYGDWRTMKFVEAALKSAASGNSWVNI